eukprot:m.31981 g.31981  ORF g.31981 m.31981 type:complete len:82 (+) comp16564_c0_seq2:150-395(+)
MFFDTFCLFFFYARPLTAHAGSDSVPNGTVPYVREYYAMGPKEDPWQLKNGIGNITSEQQQQLSTRLTYLRQCVGGTACNN